jgi:hypothetical protein
MTLVTGSDRRLAGGRGLRVGPNDRETPRSRGRGSSTGFWKRECVCSYETWREPAPSRVRLDPHDPKTARHMGACEYKGLTEPDVIKVLLRTTEKDGYWWVECAGCESGWQVPFYAQERVG